MNIAFWGKEHQSGTTAHMMALTGMLRALCGEECVVTGCFIPENRDKFAICDCGTGLRGKRRHFLWRADIAVVNLKPEKQCIESFFEEDFHIARKMIFLLDGYAEDAGKAYLSQVYRAKPDEVIAIPYNSEFYWALEHGKSNVFIARELLAPANLANEQFIRSVRTAAFCIMSGLKYEF